MKHIRTLYGFEAVEVVPAEGDTDAVVLTSTPLEVSNEKAAAYEATAAQWGVDVVVTDTDDAPAEAPVVDTVVGELVTQTGTGPAVVTPSDTSATSKAGRKTATDTPATGETQEK